MRVCFLMKFDLRRDRHGLAPPLYAYVCAHATSREIALRKASRVLSRIVMDDSQTKWMMMECKDVVQACRSGLLPVEETLLEQASAARSGVATLYRESVQIVGVTEQR